MTQLTRDRDTPERSGQAFELPVAASEEIFAGSIVVTTADGYAKAGATGLGLVVQGRAENHVVGGAADGDEVVRVKRGVFGFANSAGGDAITLTEVGKLAYLVDDQTVAKTDGTGTRSPAGIVEDVDADYVWVRLGHERAGTRHILSTKITGLDTAGARRIVSPVAGRIRKLWSVINGALATGNATITASINGVAVTGGLLTITQAASAAGDVDSATPTAANDVEPGDVIELTVGGTNTAAREAEITIEIGE